MTRKTKAPIALYSALADATRCRIVEILLAGPIPVHTLADAFSISRPAISRHLRVLKTAGLVAEVKKGRENLYALRPAKLNAATAWIDTIVSPAGVVEEAPPVAPIPVPVEPDQPVATASEPAASVVAEPDSVPPAVRRQKPAKSDRPQRIAAPEPAINQMGFDF